MRKLAESGDSTEEVDNDEVVCVLGVVEELVTSVGTNWTESLMTEGGSDAAPTLVVVFGASNDSNGYTMEIR